MKIKFYIFIFTLLFFTIYHTKVSFSLCGDVANTQNELAPDGLLTVDDALRIWLYAEDNRNKIGTPNSQFIDTADVANTINEGTPDKKITVDDALRIWLVAQDNRNKRSTLPLTCKSPMTTQEIVVIKEEIQEQKLSWVAEENSITQLPAIEKMKLLGATKPQDESSKRFTENERMLEQVTVPTSFNWRNYNGGDWTSPVKNQGSCGSCVAFAVIGALEAKRDIVSNNFNLNSDFSEEHLFSCGRGAGGCQNGWWPSNALNFLQNTGVSSETCLSYQARDDLCNNLCVNWQNEAQRIPQWSSITTGNRQLIQNALVQYGPVVAVMDVYNDFFAYKSGIYSHTQNATFAGRHAILIVGYDSTGQFWIVKNSWGNNWGENGYFRIAYGDSNIESNISYIGEETLTPPQVTITTVTSIELTAGESSEIKFSLKNMDTAKVTQENFSFLSISISNGLEITSVREETGTNGTSNGAMSYKIYPPSATICLSTDVRDCSGTSQYALLDITEKYGPLEANIYYVTIRKKSTTNEWIKYRAAFLPEGSSVAQQNFYRYPASSTVTDQQGFAVNQIDVVSPTTDPCANITCGSNATCSGGNCSCSSGYGNCDNSWSNGCEVNLNTSSNNCGACGTVCSSGKSCSNGQCVSTDLCVGVSCTQSTYCSSSSGSCVSCTSGYGNCDTNNTNCETALNTTSNCGSCGRTCSGSTPQCSNGSCVCTSTSCSSGQTCSNGQCISANTNPTITSTAVTTATVGTAYSYDVNATDADNDTLTYTLTTKPTGMTINSTTGLISWTPTTSGSYNVTVSVSDGKGGTGNQSWTIVVSTSCTNECSVSGAKECVNTTSYRQCGSNYDSDSCLEWSSTQSCSSGQTCSNGICITQGTLSPTLVGSWRGLVSPMDVFVKLPYAYIADEDAGLEIINISNPSFPSLVGSLDTYAYANGVYVSGNYAYVAGGYDGLKIIDVSNPYSPSLTASLDITDYVIDYVIGVYVSGNYAYILNRQTFYFVGLAIIDINNPSLPHHKGALGRDSASSVYISGSYAYIADRVAGLQIIDISNPSSPYLKGSLNTESAVLVTDVYVSGNYAYGINPRNLQIIDISNPSSPYLKGNYSEKIGVYHHGIYVSGSYAYIADEYAGLQIIDISNPSSPSLVGSLDTSGRHAEAVYVAGNYAYVADGWGGLKIIDISNPSSPSLVGSFLDTSGYAEDVYVAGNYAYVAARRGGLTIIDISNPSSPTLTASLDTDANGVYVSGSYAYIAGGYGGLKIIDVSNPSSPTLTASLDTDGSAEGVYVSGSYAYIADGDAGLKIINLEF